MRMPDPQAPAPFSPDDEDPHERFMRLVNAAHFGVVAYLTSLLGNRHDAEDVFQQACVTMWRRFETFTPGTNFNAWARKVAFYESREFRRLKVRNRLQFGDQLVENLAAEREKEPDLSDARLAALRHCLAELDVSSRSLIEAAYADDGDSVLAFAAKTGRAPQTLYNKLSQLRRMLAGCVERRIAEAGA